MEQHAKDQKSSAEPVYHGSLETGDAGLVREEEAEEKRRRRAERHTGIRKFL